MKNEIYLDFRISGFEDITHDSITKMLGIYPTKVYVKGQRKNPQKTDGVALFKINTWILNSPLDKYSPFDAHLNALLDILESKIDLLKPFCEKYYCEFSCALFIYYDNEESTPWVHLTSRYNELIKKLKIEFDVDIYCLPNR